MIPWSAAWLLEWWQQIHEEALPGGKRRAASPGLVSTTLQRWRAASPGLVSTTLQRYSVCKQTCCQIAGISKLAARWPRKAHRCP